MARPTTFRTPPGHAPMSGPRAGRSGVVALIAAVLMAVAGPLANTANAGTYEVVSCKTPSGQPTSTAGWTSSSSLLYDLPGDDCALGGNLSAKFTGTGGAVSGGLSANWAFRAPAGTTITTATLHRSVVARAQATDRGAVAHAATYRGAFLDDPAHRVEDCTSAASGCAPSGDTLKLKVAGTMFGISAGCAGTAGASLCASGNGSRARIAIDSARITLEDKTAPVAEVSGAALTAAAVRGRSSLKLAASDTGSGIWEAEVRLGAKVVMARRVIDRNDGRCKTLPGSQAFGWPVPCARSVKTALPFSTKGVADGPQLLTVTVWDAANNATVAVTQPISIDNARRVQADGTIMMPRIDDPLDSQLSGGGGTTQTGALRPADLPSNPQLARIVQAMDTLADAQIAYCYGGGHGTTPAVPSTGSYCWQGDPAQRVTDSGAVGFDCSSSVSWVLQQVGYDLPTITSSQFAVTGEPGEGQELTIWANAAHVYVEIKIDGTSYFWGTASSNAQHGPGWHPARSGAGFTARHLPGL